MKPREYEKLTTRKARKLCQVTAGGRGMKKGGPKRVCFGRNTLYVLSDVFRDLHFCHTKNEQREKPVSFHGREDT